MSYQGSSVHLIHSYSDRKEGPENENEIMNLPSGERYGGANLERIRPWGS